jgi:predicted Zn-dependent protease
VSKVHRSGVPYRLTRRFLLAALGSGTVGSFVSGCSENASTGRRQFVLVSDDQLAQLGQEAWLDLQRRVAKVQGGASQARLEAIGQRVVDASGQTGLNWEFVVFESPEVNAFVLPGGKVGFFRGLMELAQSDDELSAVMGHEVGHVQARHAAERMSQQLAVQLGMQVATVALSEEYGSWADEIAGALGMGALYGVILPYSRQHEFEADQLGVGLMAKAAFEPQAAVTFWQRMSAESGGQALPALLSTHPASEERLARLTEVVAELI